MDDHDSLLNDAIAALRELPQVRPEAAARVVVAVAAERQRARERERAALGRRPAIVAAVGVAAAALIGFAIIIPQSRAVAPAARVGAIASRPSNIVPAANVADAATASRPVQLVFSAPTATSVRVVGDFNGWDERKAPMVRDESSGLWSVQLMLRPGRHVYAFVVNDTQWVRDPRAASAPDADFGRPGSVVLVGRP